MTKKIKKRKGRVDKSLFGYLSLQPQKSSTLMKTRFASKVAMFQQAL
jgi:hypothetical protein